MLRDVLIAYVLIAWLAVTVFLHRVSAPRTVGRRLVVVAATADVVLTLTVVGSIWRDWVSR
jgi:fatty-acid desaturase